MLWNAKIKQTITLLHSQTRVELKWEIHSVKQHEYKTDFDLNEWKGFTNNTKHVFVWKKSWLHVQKHKGSNATVCLDKLACFMLEQMRTLNNNSPFQLLQQTLNFQTFFYSFLTFENISKKFLKHFLAALLSDMESQHYSDFDFCWLIKAWHFLFVR